MNRQLSSEIIELNEKNTREVHYEEQVFLEEIKKYTRKELEIEQQSLYKEYSSYLKVNRNSFYKLFMEYRDTTYREIFSQLPIDKLYTQELVDTLQKDLILYIEYYIKQNISERREYLQYIAILLVNKYFNMFPEEELLRPILNGYISHVQKNSKNSNEVKMLMEMFSLELKIIGYNLRQYIPRKISKKSNEIIENCIHVIMSSSSDLIGNKLNLVHQKAYLNRKLLRTYENRGVDDCSMCESGGILEKLINAIKSMGFPLDELTMFADMQSRMFTSFKNEIKNDCTGENLEFILGFVFKNGFKVKYGGVAVKIDNQLSKNIIFSLNEYITINTIYAILENAVEANAEEIHIDISNSKNYLYIDISNDGEAVPEDISDYVFDKSFSTKEGHTGMGLSIARMWSKSVDCDLEYINNYKVFRVSVPIRILEEVDFEEFTY